MFRFHTSGKKPYWQTQLSLSGSHEESVRLFAETVGDGKVYLRPARSERHRAMYAWVAMGHQAEHAARVLLPHTITKHAQLELLLEARGIVTGRNTRSHTAADRTRLAAIAAQISALNGNQNKRPAKVRVVT
jgi:hypothetical protein